MIQYHYSVIEDCKAHYEFIRNFRWLKNNNIEIIYPNPFNTLRVAFSWWALKRPKVSFQCDRNIHCYWVSAGNGGSYWPPDKIWVCPIRNNMLDRTVKHEVTHILYDQDVQGMTHEEKEAYVISKENTW